MFILFMAHQLGHTVNLVAGVQVGAKIKFPGNTALFSKVNGGIVN